MYVFMYCMYVLVHVHMQVHVRTFTNKPISVLILTCMLIYRPVSSTSDTVQSDSVSISKEDLLDGSQEITNSTSLSASSEVQEKSESGSHQEGVPFSRDMDDLMMMSPPDQPASFSSGSVSGLDTLLSQVGGWVGWYSSQKVT